MKKLHIYATIIFILFITVAITVPHFVFIILALIFLQWIYEAITEVKATYSNKPSANYRDGLTPSEALTLYRYNKYIYLKSALWQDKRKLVLARDNCHCVDCGANHNLQVHHLRYTHLGKELLDDLVTVCGDCHFKRHKIIGFPQSYEDYINFNDNK